MFHVGDEWQEFFYNSLKPWIHYIPVEGRAKSEDLKSLVEFFVNHEEIAQEIAARGREMIWNNLNIENVECYWRRLLRSYSRLMKYEIVKDKSFIEI